MPADFQMDVMNPAACNYPHFDYATMISSTNRTSNAQIPGMSQSQLLSQNRGDMLDKLDSCFKHNNEETSTPSFPEPVSPFNRLKASFKALTALMEGYCDEVELKFIDFF